MAHTKNPTTTWEYAQHNCARIAEHIPASIVQKFKQSQPERAIMELRDAVQHPADAPVLLQRVVPYVLQQLKTDSAYQDLLARAAQSNGNDADALGLSHEDMERGYRIGNIAFALEYVPMTQLEDVAALLGTEAPVPSDPETWRDELAAAIERKAQKHPALLTKLEAMLFNNKAA